MKKVKTPIPKLKLPYQSPRDKIEKLGLVGQMGYINDNSGMLTYLRKSQLAWRRNYSL